MSRIASGLWCRYRMNGRLSDHYTLNQQRSVSDERLDVGQHLEWSPKIHAAEFLAA
jgi:hypothetical protein